MKTWILTRYAVALERSFLILDPSKKERLETERRTRWIYWDFEDATGSFNLRVLASSPLVYYCAYVVTKSAFGGNCSTPLCLRF